MKGLYCYSSVFLVAVTGQYRVIMNAPASFKNPFFITRRSANLMQDLQRQISTAGAVCLVYGIEGSGKTRLIRQFVSTRLVGRKVKFCRFVSDGFFLDDDTQLHAYESIMTTLLKTPSSYSVWIIDQFELAPGEFIQQILHFWSLHASKLNCALILACRPQYLSTVYKISEQLKLKVPSVELKPLSKSESLQYISAQLCPNLDSIAVLSSELSREFKIAGGVPGLLDQIIQRHSGLIECSQQGQHSKKVKVLFLVAALMLILSPGIYLNSSKFDLIENYSVQQTEEIRVNEVQTQKINKLENSEIPGLVEPEILERGALITGQREPVLVVSGEITDSQVKLEMDTESVEQAVVVNTEIETEQMTKPQNVLQQRLSATDVWLQQSSDITASIQIMSLGVGEGQQKSLLGFLRKLEANGISLQQIYIYEMNKDKGHIYVVLFGSYADRPEARVQINSLPPSLKANSPIVRTVQGIKNEINKSIN